MSTLLARFRAAGSSLDHAQHGTIPAISASIKSNPTKIISNANSAAV
jgi:hypothetical protein